MENLLLEDVTALEENLYSKKVGNPVSEKSPDYVKCVVCHKRTNKVTLLLIPHYEKTGLQVIVLF